jgi:hypothetical protein
MDESVLKALELAAKAIDAQQPRGANLVDLLRGGYIVTGVTLRHPDGSRIIVEDGRVRRSNQGRPRRRELDPDKVGGTWRITDHICRSLKCGGRILERMDLPAGALFMCSQCEATTTDMIESLCACGVRLQENKDLGVRCWPNPDIDADHPWAIVYRVVNPQETVGPGVQVALPIVKNKTPARP